MIIEWSQRARSSARRYLADQDGMRAVGVAVARLVADPYPATGFHRGEYHRLQVGDYRMVYVVESEVITVVRVDRMTSL